MIVLFVVNGKIISFHLPVCCITAMLKKSKTGWSGMEPHLNFSYLHIVNKFDTELQQRKKH